MEILIDRLHGCFLILLLLPILASAQSEDAGRGEVRPPIPPVYKERQSQAMPSPRVVTTTKGPVQNVPRIVTPAAPLAAPPPRQAALYVTSMPAGAAVTVNRLKKATAADDGTTFIGSLKPGSYTVVVKKPGYRDRSRTVTILPNQTYSLDMALEAFPAVINVATNLTGTAIEIEGVGSYTTKATGVSVPPGQYTITASKAGYKRVTLTENFGPGQSKNLNLFLERVVASEALAEGQRALSATQFRDSLALADDVLAIEPENVRAKLLKGQSLYYLKNYVESLNYLREAISKGERVFLVVGRRKALGLLRLDETLEWGYLELSPTTISYRPAKSSEGQFSIHYGKIAELKSEYRVEWRLFIKVLVPKENSKKNKDDKKDFAFYPPSARVELYYLEGSQVPHYKITCVGDCQGQTQFWFDLISQLRNPNSLPQLKRREPTP